MSPPPPHSSCSLEDPDDHMRRMESIVRVGKGYACHDDDACVGQTPLEVIPSTEHHRFYWMDGSQVRRMRVRPTTLCIITFQKPIGCCSDFTSLEPLYSEYGHACDQVRRVNESW